MTLKTDELLASNKALTANIDELRAIVVNMVKSTQLPPAHNDTYTAGSRRDILTSKVLGAIIIYVPDLKIDRDLVTHQIATMATNHELDKLEMYH